MATLKLSSNAPRTIRRIIKDLAFHHTAARNARTEAIRALYVRRECFARNTWVADHESGCGGSIVNPTMAD